MLKKMGNRLKNQTNGKPTIAAVSAHPDKGGSTDTFTGGVSQVNKYQFNTDTTGLVTIKIMI